MELKLGDIFPCEAMWSWHENRECMIDNLTRFKIDELSKDECSRGSYRILLAAHESAQRGPGVGAANPNHGDA
jgi:hypothetical protein